MRSDSANIPLQTDPLNFAVVQIEPFFNNIKLGDATGFFHSGIFNGKRNFWLVTNWHVLTGRNAADPAKILHPMGSIPNRLRLSLIIKRDQPEYENYPDSQLLFQEQFIELYDQSGQALWYQHEKRNTFDVGIMNASVFVNRFHIEGVNDLSNANDMVVEIGNNVFILGYPLGFSHFIRTPVWKRGSIASEPHLETPETAGQCVIDATTRQGMSGSPVIMREKTHYLSESGHIKKLANATRWIGIYASRPNIHNASNLIEEDRRAEVGYFYKASCVYQSIVNGIRAPSFGDVPF
jgi:hypothetical protein